MATLRGLVQMSLQELRQAYVGNRISCQISNHAGAEAIKEVVQDGQQRYDDYGNFAGSLVMLMLLFPEEFLPGGVSTRSVLPLVDGAGDRADVLRCEGKLVQKSGRGVNNYRTNLLEAILGELGDEMRYTQKLWQYVAVRCLEDEASWSLTQGKFIERMLASNEQVTSCQQKTVSFQTCT